MASPHREIFSVFLVFLVFLIFLVSVPYGAAAQKQTDHRQTDKVTCRVVSPRLKRSGCGSSLGSYGEIDMNLERGEGVVASARIWGHLVMLSASSQNCFMAFEAPSRSWEDV